MQPVRTHRPTPWAVALVAVVAVAAAAVGFGWWALGGGTGAEPPPPASRGTEATRTVEPDRASGPQARSHEVERVLRRMSGAVLAEDRRAFLTVVDPTQRRFRAAQARIFDRVAKVPLDSWVYRLGPGPGRSRVTADGRVAWTTPVEVAYRFAGVDSTFVRERRFTFISDEQGWRLAGVSRTAAPGATGSVPDIWELGPIGVARGGRSLVIGGAPRAELLRQAELADQAIDDVGSIWPRPLSSRAVVLVPRTQGEMGALINERGKGLAQIAAVTTGLAGAGVTQGDQVVVNPRAWRTLVPEGRHVVMTHEMTHLATRAVTHRSVPTWLSEGFADYVAYRAVRVPTGTVARDVLGDVRAGRVPRELPDEAAFDATQGQVSSAYEGAWLACRMIADRYGERTLVRLYSRLADGAGGSSDDELRAVLGVGERQLTHQWRGYLRDQAGQ